MKRWCIGLWLWLVLGASGQSYGPSQEQVPMAPKEFRGAWVACVYNIDWPSQQGLSSSRQQG